MTNEKKQEIIAAMTGLLEQLTESEPPKTEPSPCSRTGGRNAHHQGMH